MATSGIQQDLVILIVFGVFVGFINGTESAIFQLNSYAQRMGLDLEKLPWVKPLLSIIERVSQVILTLFINRICAILLLTICSFHLYFTGDIFGQPRKITALLLGMVLVATIITLEWLPRRLALHNPLTWLRIFRYPFGLLNYLSRPVILLIGILNDFLPSWLKSGSTDNENVLMEDDIKTLVDQGEQHGFLDKAEQEFIHRVFAFGDKKVSTIMRDRSQICQLSANITFEDLIDEVKQSNYSRIPIYDKDVDNIIGVLYLKDILPFLLNPPTNFSIKNHLRPAYYVPLSQKADNLFREFKSKRIHLALVVDEYGIISGLITMEDLLEELFGELKDEYDSVEWEFDQIGPGKFKISSRMEIESFFELVNHRIELYDNDIKTVGGLVLNLFERIPRRGETIGHQHLLFRIDEVSGTKLERIFVEILTDDRDRLDLTADG